MKKPSIFISVLSLIYLYTLGMLYLLQISEMPWFILYLLLMHLGIVGLIVLKKRFKDLKKTFYYRNIYIVFGLFIPILIYKLIVAIFSLEENHLIIQQISIGIIAVGLVVGIINIWVFKHKYSK